MCIVVAGKLFIQASNYHWPLWICIVKYSCEIMHSFGSKIRDGEFRAELKTTLSEHIFATGYTWAQIFLPALQHSSNWSLSPACIRVSLNCTDQIVMRKGDNFLKISSSTLTSKIFNTTKGEAGKVFVNFDKSEISLSQYLWCGK